MVIGRVSDITLDEKSYLPKVSIAINEEYKEIPENSSLSIKTSGLLGEQYIALTMGFDDGETAMLKTVAKFRHKIRNGIGRFNRPVPLRR